jgi:hypothetical protein
MKFVIKWLFGKCVCLFTLMAIHIKKVKEVIEVIDKNRKSTNEDGQP